MILGAAFFYHCSETLGASKDTSVVDFSLLEIWLKVTFGGYVIVTTQKFALIAA